VFRFLPFFALKDVPPNSLFNRSKSCMSCHWHSPGFPRGFRSIEKVLNFKIVFQDLEKILNLAKMCKKYWKSMEILNGKEISIWAEFYWRQSFSLFMQCYAMC